MRILTDENIEHLAVEWLKSAGHDVLSARDISLGITDDAIVLAAQQTNRVLLTRDRDFGALVIRQKMAIPGICLVRISTALGPIGLAMFKTAWQQIHERIPGNFVVISRHGIRVRPLPSNPT